MGSPSLTLTQLFASIWILTQGANAASVKNHDSWLTSQLQSWDSAHTRPGSWVSDDDMGSHVPGVQQEESLASSKLKQAQRADDSLFQRIENFLRNRKRHASTGQIFLHHKQSVSSFLASKQGSVGQNVNIAPHVIKKRYALSFKEFLLNLHYQAAFRRIRQKHAGTTFKAPMFVGR